MQEDNMEEMSKCLLEITKGLTNSHKSMLSRDSQVQILLYKDIHILLNILVNTGMLNSYVLMASCKTK